MSFLGGRLAATEGAFFNQHSKQAAIALKQKLKNSNPSPSSANPNPTALADASRADILPEVLRHSLPTVPNSAAAELQQLESAPAPTSLAASLKLTLNPRRVELDGGLRGGAVASVGAVEHFANVPQTSFGRKKWNIEAPEVSVIASTANDARVDLSNSVDEKAVMEGYYMITKAFAVATGLVFGGSIIAAAVTTSRLGIQSADDVRTRGREYLQPQVEHMKQRFEPLRFWAQQKAAAWRMEESQRRAIGADYAKSLGIQQTEDGKWKSG